MENQTQAATETPDHIVPFEDALNRGFETSTREELLFYCDTFGLDRIDRNGDVGKLKDALYESLGIPRPGPSQRVARREVPRSHVIPQWNLSPQGRWGGRRRRIMLPRPGDAKLARAKSFGWNGKATYWLAFDEVVAVPYPIYGILLDTKTPRPKQVQVGNSGEITTGWDFSSIPFTDYGDDPLTADRPGSLTEWYQDKGEEFYLKLGDRDLRTVAGQLDIAVIDPIDRRNRPREDLLCDVLIFLFGHAPSLVDEVETITPET